MAFRDFAANRSFSENGLWHWYEKQWLARHAGGSRVRAAVGVAIPTTANSINHIHYPTRADHQADRGTYPCVVSVIHSSMVRCEVLGHRGGLRSNGHWIVRSRFR